MKHTDISQLFGVPFGAQADSTTIAAIPTSKTAIGRASMALGFPKENFQPPDNGGQPVSGADLNGILNTLARSAQAAELGVLHPFSASYAQAIGGYPAGSTIAHPTIAGHFLICTQDGNTNDPSQNMTGWDDPIADLSTRLDNETIANNYEMPASGTPARSLWSDASGQPQYTDFTNGTRALALQSTITAETQRAEKVEAALQSGYRLLNKQLWSTGGNYTYTPTAGTTHILVKLCGAGGGGGGCAHASSYMSFGGGGSGGTYAETNLFPLPTSSIAITVGSGGVGGATGTNPGSNGGVSSFGATVTCPGGIGGIGGSISNAINASYNAPITLPPGPATGSALFTVIGGYSTAGLGASCGNYQGLIGCAGGSSFFGAGAPALAWSFSGAIQLPLNYANNGLNGTAPGAGGSGAAFFYNSSSSNFSGGNGADGIVIIEEYC